MPFTLLLVCGQILPWLLLPFALHRGRDAALITLACACSLLPRVISTLRFQQNWLSALLHPVGITLFLVLQWSALLRKVRGTPATWKGRAFEVG